MKLKFNKPKCIVILLLFIGLLNPLFAQQRRSIQGKVVDSENIPLPGVSVVVKGTTLGTTTDMEGRYQLTVPSEDAVLVFSFIGMKTVERSVRGMTILNVVMEEEAIMLGEVVFTGYMTQRKSDLTGSVSIATSTDIIRNPSANAMKALQGKLPGVYITTNGGNPAEHVNIQIRGLSSLSGGVKPLIVLDGMPTENLNLRDINSDDIESINVSAVKVKNSDWNFLPQQEGDGLVVFGSGTYRSSHVYLAYQPVSEIKNKSSIQYFAGIKDGKPVWTKKEEYAKPIFQLTNPAVGELSVSYNKFIKKWILLYNHGEPRGINLRTADVPWGPWSEVQVVFRPWEDGGYCHFMHTSYDFMVCDSVHDPGRENEWGGEYGPYQFEHFAVGDAQSTTIYFTMSTWNPYQVILMKARLKKL